VRGFDHDDSSAFERTIEWIAQNRLECAAPSASSMVVSAGL
jgi:hypothetical protein